MTKIRKQPPSIPISTNLAVSSTLVGGLIGLVSGAAFGGAIEKEFATKIIEGLVSSGPLALVLGFITLTLWRDNVRLREDNRKLYDDYVGDLRIRDNDSIAWVQRLFHIVTGTEFKSSDTYRNLEAIPPKLEDKDESAPS